MPGSRPPAAPVPISPRHAPIALGLAAVLACAPGPVLPADRSGHSPALAALVDEHAARVREAPRDGSRHGELGLVYEANWMWTQARECFELAARLDRSDPIWPRHAAVAAARSGQRADAIRILREAAGRFGDFAPIHADLGYLLLEEGELEGARRAFEAALRAAPGSPEARAGLGEVQLALGDCGAALKELSAALEAAPRYRMARYLRGRALLCLDRHGEAERDLAAGQGGHRWHMNDARIERLGLYAADHGPTLERAAALLGAGRPADAVRLLERAHEWRPADVQVLTNLGVAYLRLGRAEEARDVLLEADRLRPGELLAQLNLSTCQLVLGQAEEALARADAALELAPEHARAHGLRARALAALGRRGEAEKALERARSLAPNDPAVRELARALEGAGER